MKWWPFTFAPDPCPGRTILPMQAIIDASIDSDMRERRDEFARAALQGMLAHQQRYQPRHGAPDNWHRAIAEEAYEIADAMINARLQIPGGGA